MKETQSVQVNNIEQAEDWTKIQANTPGYEDTVSGIY